MKKKNKKQIFVKNFIADKNESRIEGIDSYLVMEWIQWEINRTAISLSRFLSHFSNKV